MYNVIANINNFLEYVDKNKDVLVTERYYETMKGEALGLRAFLHFDLLRMFGPIYKEHPASKAIPYRTTLIKTLHLFCQPMKWSMPFSKI